MTLSHVVFINAGDVETATNLGWSWARSVRRTNNAHLNSSPRILSLSLSLVAFRLTFHTTTVCGQLVPIRGRDRRSVALKHNFLLLQPGRGGSEWGTNGKGEMGEGGRTSGEVQGGETRR